jgi:hypothetical protein
LNIIGILAPIIVSFSQIIFTGNRENSITGEMILMSNNEVFINVIEPVHQQMHLTTNKTIIYYPDDMRAFNIEHNNADIRMQNIPQIEPLDSNYYEQHGFKRVKNTVINDTTTIQYISLANKKNPALITQKIFDGNSSQLIIATTLGIENYLQIDFYEYEIFNNKKYIKNYSVSSYNNGELVEKTTYDITSIENASSTDLERIIFTIPPEIDIEIRNFNKT